MSVAIIIPVLRRPQNVAPLLASIAAATPEPHRIVFVCSPGDAEEIAAVEDSGADRIILDVPCGPGDYARKINRAYRESAEPFVFCGADDLAFRYGWLPAAIALATARIGVVGTQDLGNPRVIAGRHATHSLVSREYADQFGTIDERGKIFHEGYEHNFCDDELVGTAISRGAWAFAAGAIVEHRHPDWGKGEDDETYRLGQSGFAADSRLSRSRAHLWGGNGRRR